MHVRLFSLNSLSLGFLAYLLSRKISFPIRHDYSLRKRLNQALHLSSLSSLLYVCCLISIIQKDETNG